MQKNLKLLLLLFIIIAGAWCSCKLHFWTPAGQTFYVGDWKFGSLEFQVWQRKKNDLAEPFATALLVRSSSNQQWQAYSIGHQDYYAPPIDLRHRELRIEIVNGRKPLGGFDMTKGHFLRVGQVDPIDEGETESPEKWWVSP